jgi:wyosine [tRNA(Phe)-imidazoG37] synthetase (radical SAM superfamily)
MPTHRPTHEDHGRTFRNNLYVYAVVSRRSRGLSVGINLNPDKVCNFDCVYCQVDRATPPRVRKVDLDVLASELHAVLADAVSGRVFEDERFRSVPHGLRRINDIAFSGDGEPTSSPAFPEAAKIVADARLASGLRDAKIVCITDAAFLRRPEVRATLAFLDAHGGEIWAKLDAGTEDHFARMARAKCTLLDIVAGISDAAAVRPVVVQSMFLRLRGAPPAEAEVSAYLDRLRTIVASGGQIKLVQVYTVARRPAEPFVTSLPDDEVDAIAARVRSEVGLPAEAFYGTVPPSDGVR